MSVSAAVVTTFPDWAWEIYAHDFLQSYVENFPSHIPLLVQLDGPNLKNDVERIIRNQDAVAPFRLKEHQEFIDRNKDKDDKENYRKQAVRFCHKVFALKHALNAAKDAKKNNEDHPRYLIWIDADVVFTRKVEIADIIKVLPKQGDAVSYLGRKDWDHSECGFVAFDLENGGMEVIDSIVKCYETDAVFAMDQWHDSWIFDRMVLDTKTLATNLTFNKNGRDIWTESTLSEWSQHHKGPRAKQKLKNAKKDGQKLTILTKNCVPDEVIRNNIAENQKIIKNWVSTCKKNDEEIVICSGSPALFPETLRKDANKKIIVVKHAIKRIKDAGIKPWACILLDPREHVSDFVEEPDTDIIWFVASQVQPEVTQKLLLSGCKVIGYHASVGAGEGDLTSAQEDAVVSGGSATATRGIYLLDKLGFRKFKLYGYDLCYMEKPDLNETDKSGQKKYLEVSIAITYPSASFKRSFWSEPQLLAQFDEMQSIVANKNWSFSAEGFGIVPFMIGVKNLADLRDNDKKSKMIIRSSYREVIKWPNKTHWLARLPKLLPQILRKLTLVKS